MPAFVISNRAGEVNSFCVKSYKSSLGHIKFKFNQGCIEVVLYFKTKMRLEIGDNLVQTVDFLFTYILFRSTSSIKAYDLLVEKQEYPKSLSYAATEQRSPSTTKAVMYKSGQYLGIIPPHLGHPQALI